MCIMAGGTTSTPAMEILLKKTEKPPDLIIYSFTYIGVFLAMTLVIRVL